MISSILRRYADYTEACRIRAAAHEVGRLRTLEYRARRDADDRRKRDDAAHAAYKIDAQHQAGDRTCRHAEYIQWHSVDDTK